jgi:hypothetical protein
MLDQGSRQTLLSGLQQRVQQELGHDILGTPVLVSAKQSATSAQESDVPGFRRAHKAGGTESFVKLLPFNAIDCKKVISPINSSGMLPEKLLFATRKKRRWDKMPKDVLMVPENAHPETSIDHRLVQWYSSSGMVPCMFVLAKCRIDKVDTRPISEGIVPDMAVPSAKISTKTDSVERIGGSVPTSCR